MAAWIISVRLEIRVLGETLVLGERVATIPKGTGHNAGLVGCDHVVCFEGLKKEVGYIVCR